MAVTDTFRAFRAQAIFGRLPLNEFFERWQEALLECLPSSMRRIVARLDQRLVVVPDESALRFYQQQSSERQELGAVDVGDSGAVQAFLAGIRHGHRKVVIELPARQVLTHSVFFPVQVRDNLAQVMRYEIDRISPFQADQVCFDFHVRDGAIPREKLLVEVALCRRDRVQPLLQRLGEAGIPADQLTWTGAWKQANLLPPQERAQRRGSLFGMTRLLSIVVLLLAGAVLATPVWQRNRLLEDLDGELSEVKQRAEAVYEVRSALERAREGSVAVLQRKLKQPLTIDLLRQLTEVLPDDTWVQNLDVRDAEVQVRGESAQATALIGLLDKVTGISGVSFSSPVVQVAGTGKERFHITFRYTTEEPR